MKKLGVAILGLGVVGGGTYQILADKKEYFKKTQNLDVTVEAVLEKNVERAVSLGIEEAKVKPTFNPRYTLAAVNNNVITAPKSMPRSVSSLIPAILDR